jgi:hypothetical protein
MGDPPQISVISECVLQKIRSGVTIDQTLRSSYLNVGDGASFAVTRSWSVFAVMTTTVWGCNGPALSLGEVVGLSWTFRMPWARQQATIYPTEEGDSPNRAKVPTHVH